MDFLTFHCICVFIFHDLSLFLLLQLMPGLYELGYSDLDIVVSPICGCYAP